MKDFLNKIIIVTSVLYTTTEIQINGKQMFVKYQA